eukprot:TRINITY_DN109913_c0_g1_i1.p1 TRINITY_DN109913_c0_g1~~TRINITY_DN109913_c0_g1_i1.p1  ORF type:complete len:667 (+),score=138.55 TRINITY_DN109913_c0_g1_i1:28-2001(+)
MAKFSSDVSRFGNFGTSRHVLEAVGEVIETILEHGAVILQEKQQRRQLIRNTWEVAREAALTCVDMHFVPHDDNPFEVDDCNDWVLNDEPVKAVTDSFARYFLEVRKDRVVDVDSEHFEQEVVRGQPKSRARRKPSKSSSSGGHTVPEADFRIPEVELSQRILPLHRSRNPDAVLEEQFRHMWNKRASERALLLEEQAQAKIEREREEQKRRREVLQELDDNDKDTTYIPDRIQPLSIDGGGRVTFLDRQASAAPSFHNRMNDFTTFRVAGQGAEEFSSASSATGSKGSKEISEGQQGRRVALSEEEAAGGNADDSAKPPFKSPRHVFTDGFEKLQHAQPPMVESMALQRGVVLNWGGKVKAGPRPVGEVNRMSWSEYVAMTQGKQTTWHSGEAELDHQELLRECIGESSLPAAPSMRPASASSLRPTTPMSAPTPSAAMSRHSGDLLESARSQKTQTSEGRRPSSAHHCGRSQPSQQGMSPSVLSLTTVATKATNVPAGDASSASASSWPAGVKPPPVRPVSAKKGPPSPTAPAEPAPGLLKSRAAAGASASHTVLRCQPRQPRQKVINMGSHGCEGAPLAPPVGATMGHGLLPGDYKNLRAAVKNGEFYFPSRSSAQQAASKPMIRASSAGCLRRPRSASTVEGRRSAVPSNAWR